MADRDMTDRELKKDGGEAAEGVRKAFRAEESAGPPGPGRDVAEEEGVGATDTTAESPLGVGESVGRSGERIAAREDEEGREQTGVKGPSQRPYGTSGAEDSSGVKPSEPIDEESPTLPAGDQGG